MLAGAVGAQPSPPLCFGEPATITGTSGSNVLTGTNGNDVIAGLGGSDKIDGRGGDDLICGGDGNDSIEGGDGNDRIDGGGGSDRLGGDDGNDRIFGGPGNDSLSGDDGDDQLFGEGGSDKMSGGSGTDNCYVESPGDSTSSCETNLPPNEAPTANDDGPYSVNEDAGGPLVVNSTAGVLANDTDPDGPPPITAVLIAGPANSASFSFNADGGFSYSPAADSCGPDGFTYLARDGDGADSSPATVAIDVVCVNDVPSFVAGPDQSTGEDSGAQTADPWATGLSAGPANESAQALSFTVTANTNPSLFSAGPAVSPTGVLTYTPADDQFGTATVTIEVQDDGGTGNGGVDTSATQSFTITLNPVNDAPGFTKGPDQNVDEDSGPQTVDSWATGLSAGPANESGQTLTFNVTGNTNPSLFSAGPAVTPAGVLFYTPADNAFGTATITLTLSDDGGTAAGGVDTSGPQSFVITVDPVNDPPVNNMPSAPSVNEDAVHTLSGSAAISISDPDAAGDDVQVTLTAVDGTMTLDSVAGLAFTSGDGTADAAMTFSGTIAAINDALSGMTFTPTPDYFGPASIQIVTDDLGNNGAGGAMTDDDTLSITVNPINDAPSFTKGPDQNVDEDSGPQTVDSWATGLSAGPANESGQTLTFNVTGNTNPSLFSAGPAVTPAGVLFYTPADNAFGTATITLTLSDDGGTAAGGVDTSGPQSFVITVNSVPDPPVADDETFDGAIGNTAFIGNDPTDGPPVVTGPSKTITASILDGDVGGEGPGPLSVVPGTLTSNDGGTVIIEADGDFVYTSDPADSCTDTSDFFDYTLTDNNTPTPLTDVGRVTINLTGCVWYVNNNAAGNDGTSTAPFDTLAQAETASLAGHTIFVFDGDNTTTGLSSGIDLKSNQSLIGEAADLVIGPDTLHTALPSNRPTITDGAADVVVLDDNNVVRGLQIDPSGAGSGIAGGLGDTGGTIDDVAIIDTGVAGTQPSLELDSTTGTFNISNLTIDNSAATGATSDSIGVRLSNASTVNFLAAGTISITTNGARALDAAVTDMGSSFFDDITVGSSSSGAIRMINTIGSTTFGDNLLTDLSLTTTGATPAFFLNNAGTVTVAAGGTGVDNVTATGGPAINVVNTPGSSLAFSTVTSTNSAIDGINFDFNGGTTFSATSGTISGAAGFAVDVNAGTGDFTYSGALNDGPGGTAEITGRAGGAVTLSGNIADGADPGGGIVVHANSGGSTIFSGSSKVLNTGTADAIRFTSSDGHTLRFLNGSLDIDTTSGKGIEATSSGIIEVTGNGNTITTSSGTALNVADTDIGADDASFQSISSNGSVNGIRLSSTGTAGGLKVTGTGSAGSGGTIQNTTGDSVSLNSTREVDLRHMNITNSLENGINGISVTGLDLTGVNVSGSGDDSDDVGIRLANLFGSSSWDAISVTASELANVLVANTSGTLGDLAITGASHFDNLGTTSGGNSVLIEMSGTAVMTKGSIDGATFANNRPARGVTVQAQGSGQIGEDTTNAFVVQNSSFTSNGLHASFEQSGNASLTFKMLNNGTPTVPMTMPNTIAGSSHAINVASASTSTGGAIRGQIRGNLIGNPAVSGSGSPIGSGIRTVIQGATTATLLYDSNTIRQTPVARGINIQVLGPLSAAGSGPHDITVTNNDVIPSDTTGFPLSAIYVAADSQGGGTVTVRTDIRGNSVPAGVAVDSLPTYLALDRVVAAAVCQLVNTGHPSADASARLASTNTGSASAASGCTLIAGPISTPP